MGDSVSDWEKKGFKMEGGKLVRSNSPSAPSKKKPYNKYGNQKIVIDGIKFDSTKEGRYYQQLLLRKKAKEITDFKMQVPMIIEVNGIHIAKYILDFQVEYPNGELEYIGIDAILTEMFYGTHAEQVEDDNIIIDEYMMECI